MAWNERGKTNISIERLTGKILDRGKLTRQEYLLLATILLSGYNLLETDYERINRVLDYLQVGRVQITDDMGEI